MCTNGWNTTTISYMKQGAIKQVRVHCTLLMHWILTSPGRREYEMDYTFTFMNVVALTINIRYKPKRFLLGAIVEFFILTFDIGDWLCRSGEGTVRMMGELWKMDGNLSTPTFCIHQPGHNLDWKYSIDPLCIFPTSSRLSPSPRLFFLEKQVDRGKITNSYAASLHKEISRWMLRFALRGYHQPKSERNTERIRFSWPPHCWLFSGNTFD